MWPTNRLLARDAICWRLTAQIKHRYTLHTNRRICLVHIFCYSSRPHHSLYIYKDSISGYRFSGNVLRLLTQLPELVLICKYGSDRVTTPARKLGHSTTSYALLSSSIQCIISNPPCICYVSMRELSF